MIVKGGERVEEISKTVIEKGLTFEKGQQVIVTVTVINYSPKKQIVHDFVHSLLAEILSEIEESS